MQSPENEISNYKLSQTSQHFTLAKENKITQKSEVYLSEYIMLGQVDSIDSLTLIDHPSLLAIALVVL